MTAGSLPHCWVPPIYWKLYIFVCWWCWASPWVWWEEYKDGGNGPAEDGNRLTGRAGCWTFSWFLSELMQGDVVWCKDWWRESKSSCVISGLIYHVAFHLSGTAFGHLQNVTVNVLSFYHNRSRFIFFILFLLNALFRQFVILEETQQKMQPIIHWSVLRCALWSAHVGWSVTQKLQSKVNTINRDPELKSFINISSGQRAQMHLHNPKDKWIRFPRHM